MADGGDDGWLIDGIVVIRMMVLATLVMMMMVRSHFGTHACHARNQACLLQHVVKLLEQAVGRESPVGDDDDDEDGNDFVLIDDDGKHDDGQGVPHQLHVSTLAAQVRVPNRKHMRQDAVQNVQSLCCRNKDRRRTDRRRHQSRERSRSKIKARKFRRKGANDNGRGNGD